VQFVHIASEQALFSISNFIFPITSSDIEVYDHKIIITSWKEKLDIIIESAEIADAMKKIFDPAWAEAKRLDKETALGEKTESAVS
jgi:hypothetical protein